MLSNFVVTFNATDEQIEDVQLGDDELKIALHALDLKQWAAHSRDFSRELAAHALIQYDTYGIINTWIER